MSSLVSVRAWTTSIDVLDAAHPARAIRVDLHLGLGQPFCVAKHVLTTQMASHNDRRHVQTARTTFLPTTAE